MDTILLENLNSPSDLRQMTQEQLKKLADEIRQELISKVSVNGGHLASNLGVVELTIAVHLAFSSPKDQIVFDVGHQCYVHKMLTGRFSQFSTLRKKDGISGFPSPEESVHDIFKTGHSSTSISSALGLAYANSLDGNDSSSVVAIIGDGSMTGGLAYEGLNNAGSSGKNIIVILNDNKMSISKNVGSMSKALTRMRSKSGYFKFKDTLGNMLMKIPYIGVPVYRRLNRLKSAIKSYFYTSNIFESMGFKYIGPIDGHDIELISRVLNRARSLKRPVLVHVNTKKGKGYSFAEDKPREYHGVDVFDVGTGNGNLNGQLSFTDIFGKTLVALAENDKKLCAITAAMGNGCGLTKFKELYPKRYFDVGIAEQHAVTFAAGLARNGYVPVFAVYSTFLQRAYDQIIHDVSLQNLKVIFAVDRAGIVGSDGETHQGLFDIPMLLPVPNISILSPSTGTELEICLRRAIYLEKNSTFVRYPRGNCIEYTDFPFKNGNLDWELLRKNSNVAVISYGREIIDVLDAAENLRVDIIKLNLVNRFSDELINTLCDYKKLIFVEECYKIGGVGMLIENEIVNNGYNGSFEHIAISNSFVKHATQKEIREQFGIDSMSLRERINKLI